MKKKTIPDEVKENAGFGFVDGTIEGAMKAGMEAYS
jgi:hypothetical protein